MTAGRRRWAAVAACVGTALGGSVVAGPVGVAAARPVRTEVPGTPLALSDDGRYALLLGGTIADPTVTRLDRDTGAVATLPPETVGVVAGLSGDGRYVVTSRMARYDVATGAVLRPTLDDPVSTHGGIVSADGAVIVGRDDLGGVLVWRPGTAAPVRTATSVPHTGAVAQFLVTSADRLGTTAAAVLLNPVSCPTEFCHEVWLLDLVGNDHRIVSVGTRGRIGAGAAWQPALSGDGRHVAWISDAPNLVDGVGGDSAWIFVRDLGAGTVRALGVGNGLIGISDDGRLVAYRGADGSFRVADLAIDRIRRIERLAQPPQTTFPPVLSRDGSTFGWSDGPAIGSYLVDPAAAPVVASLTLGAQPVPPTPPVPEPRPSRWLPARDIGPQGFNTQIGYERLYDLTADGRTGLVLRNPFGATVDVLTGAVLPMGNFQLETRLSGDGRYVVNGGSLFDRIARTTVTPTLPPGASGPIVDLSHDGSQVLLRRGSDGAQELLAGAATGTLRTLTQGLPGGTIGSAALSADGGTAVFAWHPGPACASPVACAAELVVADVATGARQVLADGGEVNGWPTISADGRVVAWLAADVSSRATQSLNDVDAYRVRWLDRATGSERTLLYDASVARYVTESPLRMNGAGTRLATTRALGSLFIPQSTVVVLDLPTDRVHALVRTTNGRTARATDPVLSADGGTLGFSSPTPDLTAARQTYGMPLNRYAYTVDLTVLAGLDDPAGFERISDQRPPTPDPTLPAGSGYTPAVPTRLLDTRTGTGGRTGRLNAGETITIPVAGTNSIPTDAAAVVTNITAVDPTADGYLTAYPCGTPRPTASNVNYRTGDIVPNLTITKLGTDGTLCIYAHQPTDIVVDLAGWYPAASSYRPAVPTRLLDTRTGTGGRTGRLNAGETITIPVAGTNSIPTDAAAVVANITAVDPTADGYLTAYPCGTPRPTASNVNYRTGDIVPNLTITKLGTDGTLCIYAHQPTDIVVDLAGWYPAASSYRPAVPTRLLDTRTGTGGRTGRLNAGETITIPVAGTNSIPTDAAAVVANITAVDPTADGYLTAYPCGTPRPTASNVNYRTGDIVPNLTITKLGTDGTLCIYAHQPTDIVVDLAGWYPS